MMRLHMSWKGIACGERVTSGSSSLNERLY